MAKIRCVLMVGGFLLVIGGAGLALSWTEDSGPALLDGAAMAATAGAEECEGTYPAACYRTFEPCSPTCTTGSPVVDCTIEIGGCGASACSGDCSQLPDHHFSPDGDRWGWADCRYNCGYWGSTFDMKLCVWIDIPGICQCSGAVQTTGWPCPRGPYCKFTDGPRPPELGG
ncbi:MAG: hypothetical protein JSU94_07675 [Phycisphaerales bacterium]|nr:MAG: hypothetical protein JSU94_07675 [Phycisphaerales bacterium]